MNLKRRAVVACLGMIWLMAVCGMAAVGAERDPFYLIVMDPLAAPLSCPCVEGYAQREYEALAEHLESQLNRQVQLTFSATLGDALKETDRRVDLIVGKESVVQAEAAKAELKVSAIAALTDKTGSIEQTGLIVVRNDDAAQSAADLSGYDIIFGPAECDEKHAAALALLEDSGVAIPRELTIDEACSDGACKVIELGSEQKVAAVISSYAAPLLEGCGTINKGDLRVVGTTKAVPFITAFASGSLNRAEREALQSALFNVVESPQVCKKLESMIGFVEPAKKK
jgi:ABC-type phosphate/phosphonate transport system substrate-binding protein